MVDVARKAAGFAVLWIGLVSLVPRPVSAATLTDPIVGTWQGQAGEDRIRAEIGRRRGRLVAEIHVERECVRLRMTARVVVRRGTVWVTATRLGVAELRCGDRPEGGQEPLIRLSALLPVQPLEQEWSLGTRAQSGHTTPAGRFVSRGTFWIDWETVRMRRTSDTPVWSEDVPALEPAIPERICPL